MAISVVEPVSPAIERTKRILFRPFAMDKWFTLGFCAWLASFMEGGGYNANFRAFNVGGGGGRPAGPGGFPQPGPGGVPAPFPGQAPPRGMAPPPEVQQAMDWVLAHLALVIGIAAAVLLLIVSLGLLFTWLKSRGTFMFLDGVARNRVDVGGSWSEYRGKGIRCSGSTS